MSQTVRATSPRPGAAASNVQRPATAVVRGAQPAPSAQRPGQNPQPPRTDAQNKADELFEKKAKFDLNTKVMAFVDIAWAIVSGGTYEATQGVPSFKTLGIFGTVNNGMDAASSAYRVTRTTELPTNPYLENETFTGAGRFSLTTLEYLNNRKLKTLGGDLVGTGGAAGSVVTHGVNVGSGSRHLNSSITTAIHLAKLKHLAKSLPNDDDTQLSEWCNTVIKMKKYKLGGRALKLGGSVIPAGGQLGTALGGAASTAFGLSIGTGSKWHHGKDCYAAAAGLHAAAFRERGLPSSDKHATRIVQELFKRRGLTRIYGSYNVDQIIKERAGWLAIGDKIYSS